MSNIPLTSVADFVAKTQTKKVLVIVAHPDDADFGSGATVAALVDAGVEVSYCVVTSGDAGGFEDDGQDVIAERREAEQRAAADVYGVGNIHYLRERDGFVVPSFELQKQLIRVMRTERADTIVTQHPEHSWTSFQRSHPDHMAVGKAVVQAVYPAVENPYAFPELRWDEGLEPYRVHQLLMMAAPDHLVNVAFEVTDYVDAKINALLEHASQHPDVPKMKEFVRNKLRQTYEDMGGIEEGAAETFQRVVVNSPETIAGF
ncbi:PIG-L deacetylase family protein [Micrococcoides hystricis]|uniref:PIG-L deacetylase family protein n=1 Tax=Micrococcoides hystricis TaxID=1572761 RepID=A0ABV6PAF1_9MICC